MALGIRDAAAETVEITRGLAAGRHAAARRGARHLAGHAGEGLAPRRDGQDVAHRESRDPLFETYDVNVHLRFRDQAAARSPSSRWWRWWCSACSRCCKLKTDEFPDVAPPVRDGRHPVSRRVAGRRREGDPRPDRGADRVDHRREARQRQGVRRLRASSWSSSCSRRTSTRRRRTSATPSRRSAPTCRSEMEEPIIQKFNDTDRPIVSLALSSSTLSPAELTRLADPAITRELRSIAGVAEVAVSARWSASSRSSSIPTRCRPPGVSVGQVVQALQLQNLAAPVGRVTGDLDERSIRLKGRLESPQEFAQLVVAERGGQLIAARRGRRRARRHRGAAHARAATTTRKRSASTSRSRRATARPTSRDKIRARVDEIQTTLPARARSSSS